MKGINKQKAGFKFGTKTTKLIRSCGQLVHNGRAYKLVLVEADGLPYYSLRLYNGQGKFIKQFMFELAVLSPLINLFMSAEAHAIDDQADIPSNNCSEQTK